MARFWVYIGDKIQGPVDIPSLRKVSGFNLLTQVCPEGDETWRVADEVIEIKSYFLSPPRLTPFSMDAGNAAPKLDLPIPKADVEEYTLPEPSTAWQNSGAPAKLGGPPLEIIASDGTKKFETAASGPGASLRAVCETCGYKNPRDVSVCMKCGEGLKGTPAAAAVPAAVTATPTSAAAAIPTPAPSPSPIPVAEVTPTLPPNTMVELPIGKLVAGIAAAAVVTGGSFFGFHSWKAHHKPKGLPAIPVEAPAEDLVPAVRTKVSSHVTRKAARHSLRPPTTRRPRYATQTTEAAHAEPQSQEASYRVVAEATPLKKRFSSPINSPYATKRRANASLWNAQEEQAIRQVQQNRIYGGQRTIQRNVDILMQILRDREYTTAFESGKRIYLYNDMDWSASMKEGPMYEVRLTFSGGREADGSPKKPLHFAFAADLERGTVEAGAQDQLRSNTLHAYFDESRIPPEERRAIAKDTEELVLAAQPGASPLALDTVIRQFAKVYTSAALTRVADAYDLTLVKRKLDHDPRIGSDEPIVPAKTVEVNKATLPGLAPTPADKAVEEAKKMPSALISRGSAVDFRMERGAGKEKTFVVRAGSKASVDKIWEIITGYDRLKQFMPDMLASEREGQDGAAVIIHTVYLTRFMVFVFKVNLHLRVIEHPREHSLDFERIAGDFESLRGSLEVTTDPVTRDAVITFHGTVVPTGTNLTMKLEKMARRLLIPQMESLRAKAESL